MIFMSDNEEIKSEAVVDEQLSDVEKLQGQIDDLKDQLLRAVAESQNIQKRSEKEKTEIAKYSISGFAKDVLLIRDNLQLALNNSSADSNAIIDGVKLTMSELDKVLDRYGIKMVESLNKVFDPHIHQAMIEIESDQEPGTVVQVMQEGFMIYDRLLRPALVGVSKKCS